MVGGWWWLVVVVVVGGGSSGGWLWLWLVVTDEWSLVAVKRLCVCIAMFV